MSSLPPHHTQSNRCSAEGDDDVRRRTSSPPRPGHTDGDTAWTYHDDVVAGLYDSIPTPQQMRVRLGPRVQVVIDISVDVDESSAAR